MANMATILELEEIAGLRATLGRVVLTSGGFDPIHPGHASCLVASKQYGDTLVVIVNGAGFLRRKKGRPFMDLRSRCQVVACIRGVDYVVPFERTDDDTVCEAIRVLQPNVFTKGGDRTDLSNIPEWAICQEVGTDVKTGVGVAKAWSSSDFLREWGDYWMSR